MNDNSRPHIRVSNTLTEHGTESCRHVFEDLTGQLAIALCLHTAQTSQLGPDDPTVSACPLCQLFLTVDLADDLGVDLIGDP